MEAEANECIQLLAKLKTVSISLDKEDGRRWCSDLKGFFFRFEVSMMFCKAFRNIRSIGSRVGISWYREIRHECWFLLAGQAAKNSHYG